MIGGMTVGPQNMIRFNSRPLAQAETTVRLLWGCVVLVVRVDNREDGMANGTILRCLGAY